MNPMHGLLPEQLMGVGVPLLIALMYVVILAVWGLVAFFVLYQAVYRGVRRALREAGGVRLGTGAEPPVPPR